MLQGLLYDAGSDELTQERLASKELCFAYNQIPPSNATRQRKLMRRLLGAVGEHFVIFTPFWCDYGCNITIGEDFFANHNTVILDCAKVTVDDHVFVAPLYSGPPACCGTAQSGAGVCPSHHGRR